MGMELLPDWMHVYQVGEASFEAAYQGVDATKRAWIKTALASLYAWLGPTGTTRQEKRTRTGSGLCLEHIHTSREWAVVYVPASCAAAGLVVGAVLPVLAAGVWPVIAVVEAESSQEQVVLLTLELCGVETVYLLSGEDMQAAWRHGQTQTSIPPGMLVWIGQSGQGTMNMEVNPSGGPMQIVLSRPRRAAVWQKDQEIDVQALAWMHPGLDIEVWPAGGAGTGQMAKDAGARWDGFLAQEADVVWVPRELISQALTAFPLVLGPGQEPVWMWPWFDSALASHSRLAVSWAARK